MRYKTVEVREGEMLGPVDWGYDFRQHFNNLCSPDAYKDQRCAESVERLRKVADNPDAFLVVTSYADKQREVYAVGMYDGWPYWRPVPALLVGGTLGPEWHFFYDLYEVIPKPSGVPPKAAPAAADAQPAGQPDNLASSKVDRDDAVPFLGGRP